MCLISYFSTALTFLSSSKYTCYLSSLSLFMYFTLMYYLSLRCCSCFFPAQGSSLQCPQLINAANTFPPSPRLPFLLEQTSCRNSLDPLLPSFKSLLKTLLGYVTHEKPLDNRPLSVETSAPCND